MKLTPKQEKFCQCVVSGMSYKDSYLSAYDCNSDRAANVESTKLMLRDDIQERIETLLKPIEKRVTSTVISEREKKRKWLWDMINNPDVKDSDRISAMNILNKMDSEYINITQTIEEKETSIEQLDTKTLKALTAV